MSDLTQPTKAAPRGEFPPNVVAAIRVIHRPIWGEPYTPGAGPMHHAGGPYWRAELLRLANQWERMAAAARVCAEVLPDAALWKARAAPAAASPEEEAG